MSDASETYLRFSLSDRIQHVLLIVSFSLLALTGVPQKFSSLDWAKTLVNLMGGIDMVRAIHHVNAIVLIAVCLYHVLNGAYRLIFKHARFEMLPQLKDAGDAAGNIAYFLGIRKLRPRFDRYNYMEKFEYWAVVWGMSVMALTGLALWFPVLFTSYIPGILIPAAKSVHGGEALLAVAAIVLWHLYNTHLNPRVFPVNLSMFTGRVSKHEMMEEHPVEYERKTGETVPPEWQQGRPAQSWLALGISGALGALLILVFALLISWVIRPPSPTEPAPLNLPLEHASLLQPPAEPLSAAGPQPTVIWNPGAVARPSADFLAEAVGGTARLEGPPPLSVNFTDLSAGEITTWLWDFGDGETSAEQNPQHTFNKCPGDKEMCTIQLTVCGPGGCDTNTKVDHLWVSAKSKP